MATDSLAGGAFNPKADYTTTGNWTFSGNVTVNGTLTDTGSTLASPVITGTVTGGATYTAPTFTTPTLGVATATSVNKVAITAPAAGATLALVDGTTVTGPAATGTLATLAGSETLTNKTIASSATVPYVAGVAAGYKAARVEMALDGSNPSSWATGLATIIAAGCTLKGSAAPGVGTCLITAVINGTSVDFYGWKPTGSGDCTLIASTGTESFYAWAIGT